jgi:hypothetical protein
LEQVVPDPTLYFVEVRIWCHFVGQSTILTLTSDRGTSEAYCLAHHLTIEDEKRQLMIAALRYHDTFVKMDGTWLFAERLLYVDWIEERTLS